MRFSIALLVLGSTLLVGCDGPVVKDEYFTIDQLKETKKFVGYEIYEHNPKIEGPYRLSKEVNTTIPRQGNEPFDYQVRVKDVDYRFTIENDAIGYGFRFLSVRNPKNELGIILLKTTGKLPDILERNKEKLERMNRGRKGPGGQGKARTPQTTESVLARLKETADPDGDGKFSKDDLPRRFQGSFDQYDANSDGFIDETEAEDFAQGIVESQADDSDTKGGSDEKEKSGSDNKDDDKKDADNKDGDKKDGDEK